jgi:hypothetical protein
LSVTGLEALLLATTQEYQSGEPPKETFLIIHECFLFYENCLTNTIGHFIL